MKRWCLRELEGWKANPNRKPLLLLGARQVGKTWLMQEFGKQHYRNVAYIRFDKDAAMRQSFEQDYDIRRLLNTIHLRTGVALIPGETLIILDEIQECAGALTSLKYFCEEAREHHIMAAGSLLGLEENIGTGFPVGKVDRVYMYPMSFTEFLDAVGYGQYVELLRSRDWGMVSLFGSKLEELLRYYYYVGGMPAAVAEYVRSGDMQAVRRLQNNLLADYRVDFRKHATAAETHLITQVWDSLPEQLAQENKRFVHAAVGEGVRAPMLRGPIRWLDDAAMVQVVPRVKKPELPLSAYQDGAFKMFFLDVGLLAAKCKLKASVILEQNSIFGQYKGALTEQYVQQQLRTDCGIAPFYWAAERAQAEVDFLVETEGGIVPMEVKAERNLRAKSLQSFCKRYQYPIAVRLSMSSYEVNPIETSGKHRYTLVDMPLYAVVALPDEVEAQMSVR